MKRARIARTAPAALGLAAIFIGLAAGGANTAELAALLSCALLAIAIVAVAATPRATLAARIAENALPAAAAAIFAAWSLATALHGFGPPDPLWRKLGFEAGAISISPYRTLEGLVSFLSALAAFALGAVAVREPGDRTTIGRLVVFGALGFACYALVGRQATDAGRLMVNFGSANVAATLFGMSAVFAAAAAIRAARGKKGFASLAAAPVASVTLVLSLLCLMLTASRAGLAATLIALIVFAILLLVGARMRTREKPSAALVWLAAFVALLFLAGGHFALARLDHIDAAAANRAAILETHWRAFLDRPLMGHGLNTFHELNAHYATPETYGVLAGLGSAHNIYLQALEETGVFGALLFVLMLAPPLARTLARALRGAIWAAAMAAAALLALLHGLVDFALQTPAIAALFTLCLGAFSTKSGQPDQ